MTQQSMRRRLVALLTALGMLAVLSPQIGALARLPDAMVLQTGAVACVDASLPLSAEVTGGVVTAARERSALNLTAGEESGTAQVVLRLLGLVPVKTVQVTVRQPRVLIPGGRTLGVAVQTRGVVVVGASDLDSVASPARRAGIRAGDVIETVDGEEVNSAEALSQALADGTAARVGLIRGGSAMEVEVQPARDPRDGVYKLGVWVRQSTAGVGTLTYYDPETGGYGALGHAITDVDTGVRFPVGEGAVYENEVVSITRGSRGTPGELTGAFFEQETELGSIERNTDFGVFGSASETLGESKLYPDGLPVALRDEVHAGRAAILASVDGQEVKEYDCEIEKVYDQSQPETRSMVVRITDPELLERTGGIVQGMSGSPIVQDGKLVGAVTHVLINDPARGYGVFIEWMLDAASGE